MASIMTSKPIEADNTSEMHVEAMLTVGAGKPYGAVIRPYHDNFVANPAAAAAISTSVGKMNACSARSVSTCTPMPGRGWRLRVATGWETSEAKWASDECVVLST